MCELLIFTNSYDTTTDLLLGRLGDAPVFRFNFDLMESYKIRFNDSGFRMSDPAGRTVDSRALRKAYWRKPFAGDVEKQEPWADYVDAEMRYVLAEMVNSVWSDQRLVLVEPFAERRTGKLMQLHRARGIFPVPEYEFVFGDAPTAGSGVVKSLSSEPVGDKVLYTTKVRTGELDTRFPWFIERYVEGRHDVTVVFVRGLTFAFSLRRDFVGESVDWQACMCPEQKWTRHPRCPRRSMPRLAHTCAGSSLTMAGWISFSMRGNATGFAR